MSKLHEIPTDALDKSTGRLFSWLALSTGGRVPRQGDPLFGVWQATRRKAERLRSELDARHLQRQAAVRARLDAAPTIGQDVFAFVNAVADGRFERV